MQEEIFEPLPSRWVFLLTFHWLVYPREAEWSFYISERMERSKSAECANFSGHRARALYQGTASAVPYKNRIDEGFSPWGTLVCHSSRVQSVGNGSKSRTSAAKAAHIREVYGTAEAVP
jgi:hypothetical protein